MAMTRTKVDTKLRNYSVYSYFNWCLNQGINLNSLKCNFLIPKSRKIISNYRITVLIVYLVQESNIKLFPFSWKRERWLVMFGSKHFLPIIIVQWNRQKVFPPLSHCLCRCTFFSTWRFVWYGSRIWKL